MTESTKIDYVSIVQDLRDEADLCRNETATDIADLLDDAASCIVAMKSQFTALRSELAAAQSELEQWRKWGVVEVAIRNPSVAEYMEHWEERAQRAEALAESRRIVLHEICEEWAGAECGEPVTAQEAYAIQLAKRMYQLAIDAAIAGEKP